MNYYYHANEAYDTTIEAIKENESKSIEEKMSCEIDEVICTIKHASNIGKFSVEVGNIRSDTVRKLEQLGYKVTYNEFSMTNKISW